MGWGRMEFRAWQGLQPRKRHVPDKEARTLLVSLPCSGRVPPLIFRLTTVGRRLRSAGTRGPAAKVKNSGKKRCTRWHSTFSGIPRMGPK